MIRAVCLSTLSLMLFGCLSQGDAGSNGNLSISADISKLDRSDTIIGIDRNKNGIRDDIEVIIQESYDEPLTKQLVLDLARNLQKNLTIDYNNEKQVVHAHIATEQSINCLDAHLDRKNMAINDVVSGLNQLTNNTGDRFSHAVSFENAVEDISLQNLPHLRAC